MNEVFPPPGTRAHLFAHAGDMGRRIAAFDWSTTPVGAPDGWPPALRHALALILPSCAQMLLLWGPDHLIFYNDAFARSLGDSHPAALGQPARRIWRALWNDLQPLVEKVQATGETVAEKDRPFDIRRSPIVERVYFDISLSPVVLEHGGIGGVLCVVSDTTARVRALEEMVAERERLRAMFDQAPGFLAVLREPGHVFELVNGAYRRMAGDRPLLGLPFAEALPEAAPFGVVEQLDEVVRTGEPFHGVDVPVPLPRTTPGPRREHRLDFICQPITDANGVVTAIFIKGADRTDRYQAELALAQSRLSLEQATEAGEVAIWTYDVARDELSCSPRGWSMHGLAPEGRCLSLTQFGALMHPEDRVPVRAAFMATLDPAVRALYDIDYRIVDQSDGTLRWIAARGRGLFDDGRCVSVSGTLVDITARQLVAAATRESEERFRLLADSLPALVWMTEPDGRVTFASKGFETILGVSPDTIMDKGWVDLLPPSRHVHAAARRREWLRNPSVLSGDYPLVGADGTRRWFHAEGRPRFVGATFQGYISCAIDVTEAHAAGERLEARVAERTAELTRQIAERERVEETLHQMQRLEAVGQLTSGIAHDFNNLLTVVLGNVDAIALGGQRAPLDARMKQRLDHIRLAAERGATLTAQLLAFSRRQRLEAKVVDLNGTVAGLSDLLGSTLGRSIAVETRLADPVWPALVDPTQIELIILNLAINARDAMPGGGTLTVSTTNVTRGVPQRPEEPPPGDYVCVAVADTGSGMSDAVLARAFEPFFTTKEVGKGSGLGLAQVFGFAKQSGGGVRIDSEEGAGTVVSVFLPRAADIAPAVADSATPVAAASIAGRTVLVLDDEDRVRAVAAETLRDAGCRVIEACDGTAALEALAHEPGVELVVADVAMPVMTGVEFAQRAEQLHPGLPILFVTGYVDLSTIVDVPEERLIRKPYPRKLLLERVRGLLHPA